MQAYSKYALSFIFHFSRDLLFFNLEDAISSSVFNGQYLNESRKPAVYYRYILFFLRMVNFVDLYVKLVFQHFSSYLRLIHLCTGLLYQTTHFSESEDGDLHENVTGWLLS